MKFAALFCLIYIVRQAIGEDPIGQGTDDRHAAETAPYDYQIELDERGNPLWLPCDSVDLTNDKKELSDKECSILKVFNQTQADLMDREQVKRVAETCACELLSMLQKWTKSFYTSETRQVARMVWAKTNESLQRDHTYPVYFWNDVDIVSHRVSIYTSTRDYFYKLRHEPASRLSPDMRQKVADDANWQNILFVCRKISQDRYFVFRYLENLARLDPSAFFRLVLNNRIIDTVYQSSKACKMLLLLKLNRYKLRPDDETIVVANRPDGESAAPKYNIIDDSNDDTRDIETMIYQAKSLMPHNCHKVTHLQHNATANKRPTDNMQASECPIRFNQGDTGDNVKIWLAQNATEPSVRSIAAIQCGCQLLMHNSTWDTMIRNPDVAVMAKALTNYLNNNRVPDVASSPTWILHGWFEDLMWNLTKTRKGPISEIMKTKRGGQEDSTEPANKDAGAEALDLLRRGCLVVALNYDPVTRRKGHFRLVQYLDELQSISADPMFVFQLALQDINLFKIYALSKMCEPMMRY